jgi:hypothetical protein
VEGLYRDGVVEPAATFPADIEHGIDSYLEGSVAAPDEHLAGIADAPLPQAPAPEPPAAGSAVVADTQPGPGPGRER